MTRTWSLCYSDDHGITGEVRLTIDDERASYDARITLPGFGYVVVADDELRAPTGSLLEVRGDGLWAEFVCEVPGEHWATALEAFGLRFEDAEEARGSDRGDRIPVGLDLEWETPDVVTGEILAGSRRWPFTGHGTLRIDQ